jgi:hypothetical protein
MNFEHKNISPLGFEPTVTFLFHFKFVNRMLLILAASTQKVPLCSFKIFLFAKSIMMHSICFLSISSFCFEIPSCNEILFGPWWRGAVDIASARESADPGSVPAGV